jgi:hypothetical protein
MNFKNIELYRAWLRYLGENTYVNRTEAYINSQMGLKLP